MSETKNEIGLVDDAKNKHWEETKPQMLLMVDGQATVTRTLAARSGKYCGFRHIARLVIQQQADKATVFWGWTAAFNPGKMLHQPPVICSEIKTQVWLQQDEIGDSEGKFKANASGDIKIDVCGTNCCRGSV